MTHEEESASSVAIDENVNSWKRVERLEREIERLMGELARFKEAVEILPPQPPVFEGSLYVLWLEGKVRQLQGREQLIHEQGRGYAEPKLENRQLRDKVERLEKALSVARDELSNIRLCGTIVGAWAKVREAEAEIRQILGEDK